MIRLLSKVFWPIDNVMMSYIEMGNITSFNVVPSLTNETGFGGSDIPRA